jgi:hypothetical protein
VTAIVDCGVDTSTVTRARQPLTATSRIPATQEHVTEVGRDVFAGLGRNRIVGTTNRIVAFFVNIASLRTPMRALLSFPAPSSQMLIRASYPGSKM